MIGAICRVSFTALSFVIISAICLYHSWCWFTVTQREARIMISSTACRSIVLKTSLDEGLPGPEHFTIQEFPISIEQSKANLKEGELFVKLRAISADPYLRLAIKTGAAGIVATKPGTTMKGFVVAQVVSSRNRGWQDGDFLGAELPFVTFQTLSADQVSMKSSWKLTGLVNEQNLTYGVGVLGMPGAAAYGGLISVLKPNIGETILISSASGAVGSLVGQIAKTVFGCKVIGICGGKEKCKMIQQQFGFDHAIDYQTFHSKEDLVTALENIAPEGIDMYWENVGGINFEAALEVLRPGGRVAICGWISDYNSLHARAVSIRPVSMIFAQQKIEGFLFSPWLYHEKGNFLQDMARLLQEGKLKIEETPFDGMESWPSAFQSLFTGAKVGKVVVRV